MNGKTGDMSECWSLEVKKILKTEDHSSKTTGILTEKWKHNNTKIQKN